jgi:ribonuclease BN (tRNA processing enzyme)
MNCILIDNKLVLDAGGLTASLSLKAQIKLRTVCLTHAHYDHVRDMPALGMNLYLNRGNINICTTAEVYTSLTKYLINDDLYPNWFKRSVFKFTRLEHYQSQSVNDYTIMAVPVNHSVPTVGYQVGGSDGKTLFYTGDTGTGLTDCWRHVSPQLLIIEVTAPNKNEESIGNGAKHLTPRLLHEELTSFRALKGYLPRVLIIHMDPPLEDEIRAEIAVIAESLNCSITLAYEGMKLNL